MTLQFLEEEEKHRSVQTTSKLRLVKLIFLNKKYAHERARRELKTRGLKWHG